MPCCLSCQLGPTEQVAHRHVQMQGLCGPGRCVVNATVWLVWPDTGEPLGFVTPIEQDLADSLHRAGWGHLSPIPPRKAKKVNES